MSKELETRAADFFAVFQKDVVVCSNMVNVVNGMLRRCVASH